jgi:hypothetical protein
MTMFRAERLLARTFFGRFFETEVLPAVPQAQLVIWTLAALGAPGFTMALRLAGPYSRALRASRTALSEIIMRDQVLYVTYSMMALAFIALLMWESVFPDRRDARVLGVLPLSTRTHVIGRLAALGAFAVLFSVGINVPAAIAYGFVLFVYEAAAGPLRNAAGHVIATALAGLFGFFLVIVAQGTLLTLFGRTVVRRLALVLQSLLMVAFLQVLLFVPWLSARIGAGFRNQPSSIAVWLPPAWFLALYDILAGTRRALHGTSALAAPVVTVAVMATATVLIASSYRRLVRMALEAAGGGGSRRVRVFRRVSGTIAGLLRTEPIQRAVAGFTLRSLGRSRTHLTLLSTYVGVAAALVVATLLPVVVTGPAAARESPGIVLLSVPLVWYFFILLGTRALVGIPTELKANWIFRLAAPEDRAPDVTAGVRLALLLAVVAAIAAAAGLLGSALWGLRTGAIHLGVTAALGLLLLDGLLVGFRKIPFACTYYPGRSRAATLWPFYLVALVIYAYGLGAVERAAMTNGTALLVVVGVIAAVYGGLAYLRRLGRQRPLPVVYQEEEPDRAFEGFKLSEGLAAQRSVSPVSGSTRREPRQSTEPLRRSAQF